MSGLLGVLCFTAGFLVAGAAAALVARLREAAPAGETARKGTLEERLGRLRASTTRGAATLAAPVEAEPSRRTDAPASPSTALGLLAQAMRDPLGQLRRSQACPPETIEQLERIAWQSRMLSTVPRPMKATPTSPIALLQQAAEEVPLLRLGKVAVSWTIRDRQPVHVDAERARAAFRELLWSAAEQVGEGGRLAIRILPGEQSRHPIRVEIESGRREAEPDALATLVGRRLLECQGARVESEGPLTSVFLRSLATDLPAQTLSNR